MRLLTQLNGIMEDLRQRYAEPGRFYHTQEHIDYMMARADEVDHLFHNRVAVDLAIWYHDAVYDTKRHDNEMRSADLFIEHHEKYLSTYMQGYVVDLILATINHALPPHHSADFISDCALFLDIDLASLGLPWEQFNANTEACRKEYAHVPEKDFNQGRGAILDEFLSRDPLYFSPYFQNYFHDPARRNLKKSIHLLTGKQSDKFPWISAG